MPLHPLPYVEADLLPYEAVRLTLPWYWLAVDELRPTQDHLSIEVLLRLAAGGPTTGPDFAIHVVEACGALWIHNGHHRWALRKIAGAPSIPGRVQPWPPHRAHDAPVG